MRFMFLLFTFIILAVVGAVVGPSFVDWNKYKPQIIEQVKNAAGLDVQLDGDLSLAIIPSPRLKIEDAVVDAPLKKNFDEILRIKSVEVSVALLPLLQKQIQVKSVTLMSPDIKVEVMEDGRGSWMTDKLAKAQEVKDASPEELKEGTTKTSQKVLESIALDKLKIEKGNLQFVNHQTGANQTLNDVNVTLKANSLRGPFIVDGNLVYQDKKIQLNAQTGKLPKQDEGLSIQAKVALPDAGAALDFKGVTTIKEPYEVQGQTNLNVSNPNKLKAVTGVALGSGNEPIKIDGLLTANEDKVSIDNLKLMLGGFTGNGKISVQDLKAKNPLKISGDLKSSSFLDLNDFISNSSQSSTGSKAAQKTTKESSFVPKVLTLPMPIDVNFKMDLAGVKIKNNVMKGVFLDLNKSGKETKVIFKALELPGQAKADGTLNISYASGPQSSKTGQMIYSDPTVSYNVNGQAANLVSFFKSFAPDANTKAITQLYKTANFNLKGDLNGNVINLKDSVLKLDQMVVGLGGSYKAASNGGRAKVFIDLTADTIDFDKIMQAQGKKPTASTGSKTAKQSLAPVQGFSLPLDLAFDVSLQKARINGQSLNGLRLVGDVAGQKLNLKTASVNNFSGATISAKGSVGDLRSLSGLDLNLYTKTSNLNTLAQALKVDVSKLPKDLKALELSVDGKGNTDQLNFDANIKALNGQLDAKGIAKDILGKPNYSNLTLGVKHSNLVKAIQIVNPSFKGQSGLNQAINFSAKANINGKQYDLSDMKVTLGSTNFGGNLKINAGAKPVSVRGNIAAGKIALDSLLGAKSSGGSSKSSGGSSGSSGGKWSKAPIDLKWMNDVDVNVDLSASNITYGSWNFAKPSTDLKIGGGKLNVNNMKAGVFGGTANLTTEVKSSPVSITLSNKMNSIDLEKLAKALSGSGKLKTTGTVNFDMDVSSVGGSSHALINALAGKANLNGTNVTLKGFDLVKLARGLNSNEKLLSSAASLASGALGGGQTQFDTVKGDYTITNGKIDIQSMSMDNNEAVINSTGYADLPKDFIKVNNEISLKNVADFDPFNVEIKGSLGNPKTFGKNILEDRLKKKLGDKLPDLLGDKAADKLKKFGVVGEDGGLGLDNLKPENLINNLLVPKKKAEPEVAPASEPANDNVDSGAEKAAPVPVKEEPKKAKPAPVKEAPKKIEKPEDALKTILDNKGSPEDAVNDLIKGLF